MCYCSMIWFLSFFHIILSLNRSHFLSSNGSWIVSDDLRMMGRVKDLVLKLLFQNVRGRCGKSRRSSLWILILRIEDRIWDSQIRCRNSNYYTVRHTLRQETTLKVSDIKCCPMETASTRNEINLQWREVQNEDICNVQMDTSSMFTTKLQQLMSHVSHVRTHAVWKSH